MRRHKILTRTLLILSIINFALAAPAAVRGRLEVHLDANVIRDATAAPQKRGNPLGAGGSTNVPGPDYTPQPSLDLTDILSQTAYVDSPPPTPDNLPPSPELPTGSRLPVGSMPAGSLPPPPPPPPHSQPGPSEDRIPSMSGFSVNPDTLSATGSTGDRPTPPQSPGPDPEMDSLLNPEAFPSDFWDNVLGGRLPVGSMPAGSLPPPPPPPPHHSQPGPSEDRISSPSGFSVNPDTSSATGLTGDRATPPQSPGPDPEMDSLLNPEAFPSDFWDKVLKGKFKRRISGSDVVNLAQKDTRSRIF